MRKRVLLISSWTNNKKVLGYYLSPPMGLYRIQNWLKDKHDVDILDPNVDGPVGFIENHGSYDVFGFSPTKDNLHNDIALMRYVRKLYPKAQIVLGGVEATCNYQTLLDLNVADFIIMGEGEKALEYFLEGRNFMNLSPSAIAKHYSYSTVLNSDEFAKAIDVDFSAIPIKEYWRANAAVTNNKPLSTNCVNLYITNYCPQGCKFCSTTRFIRQACPSGAKVVTIKPSVLVALIKKIMASLPDTKTIYFHDDNACYYRDATIQWCKLAIEEGIDVSYVASSMMSHFDQEMLEIMKKAGFRKLSCGVEAYSDALLKKIHKAQRTEDIDKFIAITKALDLPVHLNVILCQPEAELDDAKKTAEFGLRILQDKRNTLNAEPYIKAYSGSWYFDNWDRIEYRYNKVPSINGTKSGDIRIPARFLPRDPEVQKLLERIDDAIRSNERIVKIRSKSYLSAQISEELCKIVLDF